jgi:hypothetical protein
MVRVYLTMTRMQQRYSYKDYFYTASFYAGTLVPLLRKDIVILKKDTLVLYIKNMVCFRCKMVVTDELIKLGFHPIKVELGIAHLEETLTKGQHDLVSMALQKTGLELLDNKKSILIQKIKNIIIDTVHYSEEPLVHNLSVFLSDKLDHNYTYMSNLFSERLGTTIEKFYICHKIERVKELLIYDELTLTEIALKLHYSSTAHLSNQFKKITGLTPSRFKRQNDRKRHLLETI